MTTEATGDPEEFLRAVASQLRRPDGDMGKEVGRRMNDGNLLINRYAINALTLDRGANVLEIGMGNGYFASDILALADAVSYTGCDHSSLMVAEAEALNQELVANGRARFANAAAENLPFAAASFDAVLSVNTVYFWEIDRALANIRRVLKPTGQLTLALRPQRVMETYAIAKHGFQLFSAERLTNCLREAGFTLVSESEYDEPGQEIAGSLCEVATLVLTARPQA